jgi:hypothetical protein
MSGARVNGPKRLESSVSEVKTGWASMSTVADMLNTADNLSRIEFYAIKYDNKPAELNCRCPGLPGMAKADLEALTAELNVAIAPVIRSLQGSLQSKAANQLRRFL